MKNTTDKFIEFCLSRNILQFGNFTLKSGRESPYFFNLGLINSGEDLRQLGMFYAEKITSTFSKNEIDTIFGPAYKGIPLATATAIALSEKFSWNMGVTFNRKEAKDHGEGGIFVGASVRDKKVLILDDLITAGTAIRQSIQLLKAAQAQIVGIALAINREEKGASHLSAIEEVKKEFSIPVSTLISLSDLIVHLKKDPSSVVILKKMQEYQKEFGAHYDPSH